MVWLSGSWRCRLRILMQNKPRHNKKGLVVLPSTTFFYWKWLNKGLVNRGKEMSLSRDLGHYYKLPKTDSNAVYLLSNSVYYLSTLSGNSLFPRKLYKVILACQQ